MMRGGGGMTSSGMTAWICGAGGASMRTTGGASLIFVTAASFRAGAGPFSQLASRLEPTITIV